MNWFKYGRFKAAAVFLFTAIQLSAQNGSSSKIIVIDPGHGGKDPGAIGISGMKEKDIALKLALEILLLDKHKDKQVYLTRYTDTLISLKDRVNLAKALKGDLFISLHCNHSNSSVAKGVEIFVAENELSRYFNTAILFAYEVHKNIKISTGIKPRGVKFANFQVLKQSIPYMPSMLLEMCFISNPDEQKFIKEENNIKAIALLIYNLSVVSDKDL